MMWLRQVPTRVPRGHFRFMKPNGQEDRPGGPDASRLYSPGRVFGRIIWSETDCFVWSKTCIFYPYCFMKRNDFYYKVNFGKYLSGQLA